MLLFMAAVFLQVVHRTPPPPPPHFLLYFPRKLTAHTQFTDTVQVYKCVDSRSESSNHYKIISIPLVNSQCLFIYQKKNLV